MLDACAIDYLTKPFVTIELLARVRVGLRDHGQIEATPVFKSGDIEVDLNQRKVFLKDKPIKLSATEFEILALLIRDQGKVVPLPLIMKKVWGVTAEDQSHYLRIYINQIRKKIEANPSEPKHIITEPGIGYKIQ